MSDKRPVNLDIGTIKLPVAAWVSILHRISGVVLFFATGLFLWMLDASLASEESFRNLKTIITHPLCQLVIWGMLAALAYHLVAGIRHLIMDCGIGETLEGGARGAKIVLLCAGVLFVLAGAWLWL
ncbi:MAG: succinate dehydrogenase, cytochrome b556 subunit [Porticoccaceae bacterium]